MMCGSGRYGLLLLLFFTVMCSSLMAQEVDYDYRYYKFYQEDDESLLNLSDSLPAQVTVMPILAQESEYVLRSMNFAKMGERYMERYSVGHVEVDYTTARMLSQLKFSSDMDEGFRGEFYSSSLRPTKQYRFEDRYFAHDAIKAEFSGRNYLGGISYFGYTKPDYMGVLLNDGWAYRYSARITWGNDLYVKGVYGDVANIAFNATYKSRRSDLNIILLNSFSQRGLRRASVDEAYALLGDKEYNPVWGWQGGKVRNSSVATLLRPEAIVSWDYRLSVSTTMTLIANALYSNSGVTRLSWFNAPTPLPDNYHYLPSYYALPSQRKPVTDSWLRGDARYTQIDWEGLYHTNALQRDGRARYIVEARMEDSAVGGLAVSFATKLKGVNIDYGARLNYKRQHIYKLVDDLLGASHIVDLDYYMVDDATEDNGMRNNMKSGNSVAREGDIFGYNYVLSMLRASLFGSASWQVGDMGFCVSADMSNYRVRRRGLFEKEAFAGAGSYGRSQRVVLNPYSTSLVWNYTLGNHMFAISAVAEGDVPEQANLFLNPEYNNRIVENPSLVHRYGLKAGYGNFESNRLRFGVDFFVSGMSHDSRVLRYYDDLATTYVDSHVRGLSQFGIGLDMRAEVNWNRWLFSNFRVLLASYRYSDNATVKLYSDSNNMLIARSVVAVKGCHAGPSERAMYADLGFNHRGWVVKASLSATDGGYLSPSFTRYSERILSLAKSSEERDALMTQRKLPVATSVDLNLRKEFEFDEERKLVLSMSVRNLLGDRWITSGYESNRMRRVTTDYFTRLVPNADVITYSYPQTFYFSLTYWL